jgi:hypothetical protein
MRRRSYLVFSHGMEVVTLWYAGVRWNFQKDNYCVLWKAFVFSFEQYIRYSLFVNCCIF